MITSFRDEHAKEAYRAKYANTAYVIEIEPITDFEDWRYNYEQDSV